MPRACAATPHHVEDALNGVVGDRRRLMDLVAPVGLLDDEVGESAAGVDGKPRCQERLVPLDMPITGPHYTGIRTYVEQPHLAA